MKSRQSRGASSIATTAALSVAILIAAIGSYIGDMARAKHAAALNETRQPSVRQEYRPLEDADGNGTPDWQDELVLSGVNVSTSTASTSPVETDPVASLGSALVSSLLSGYVSLKQYDSYTPERGEKLASTLVSSFKAPDTITPYTVGELTLDEDPSLQRLLQYRADMRGALADIVDFEAEPEFATFARFVQTGDRQWLDKLSEVARKYRVAEAGLLAVKVPANAADVHLRALNALAVFVQTLERLVRFANDPLATMALLRTYNESEREFLLAFDALAKFYVEETGN